MDHRWQWPTESCPDPPLLPPFNRHVDKADKLTSDDSDDDVNEVIPEPALKTYAHNPGKHYDDPEPEPQPDPKPKHYYPTPDPDPYKPTPKPKPVHPTRKVLVDLRNSATRAGLEKNGLTLKSGELTLLRIDDNSGSTGRVWEVDEAATRGRFTIDERLITSNTVGNTAGIIEFTLTPGDLNGALFVDAGSFRIAR